MLLISEDFVIYFILFIAEKLGDITYWYYDTFKTWHGERAAEIPIVTEMVRNCQGKNILEIGMFYHII
jgi:hypothetical protein